MNKKQLEIYWNDIPIGKREAATYAQLQLWWNVDERQVRRILHELSSYDNGDDYILIRSGKSKGFYKTDDKNEIEVFKKECLNKGRSVFAPVKKINRVLAVNAEQYSIDNNMRLVRERLGIPQAHVCEWIEQFDKSLDVPMLSKMENGVCMPTPYQLALLAKFYLCEPSDLIATDLYL